MIFKVSPNQTIPSEVLSGFISSYNNNGTMLSAGSRNSIKIFEWKGCRVAIKSFKIPVLINSLIYGYIRKSKARRSYEYAMVLLKKNIGTPNPIAYFENRNLIGLQDSYYICEHLDADLTFRELVSHPDYPDHDNILRQFTAFTFDLHQKGIEFMDHSPGNTLIKNLGDGRYSFYLVDLNRMKFHNDMPFSLRMKNLSRLTPKKEMIAVMSNEYSKLTHLPEKQIFDALWKETSEFQYRYFRKKRLKKKLFFWK